MRSETLILPQADETGYETKLIYTNASLASASEHRERKREMSAGQHRDTGGDEEFHAVEIGEPESGAPVASEPQLMPTSYDPGNFSFVSIPSATDEEVTSSTIAPAPSLSGAGEASWGSIKTVRSRPQGRVSQYLDSKGFGFLLEVEEEEGEEEQKPLLEELDIDLKDIYVKLRCVLLPLPSSGAHRASIRDNPDFWGPLLVVLIFALISVYGQFRVVSWIVIIWIFGSLLVFVLARVLGGEVSYSQTLGVVGYSLLPLALVAPLVSLVSSLPWATLLLKGVGVLWSTYSAGSLLAQEELRHKKLLLLYPILLVYIYFFSLYTGA